MRRGVVILPERSWPDARAQWERAEELGFDHAWTYDHLAWRSLRDSSWFGAIPTLTAAALATKTIRLGPLVASPNFRHPVPLAKELVTLDDISRGRLTFGVGSGGVGWDATVLGPAWSARERTDRFVEFVELLDLVLREPAASRAGTFYSADEARTYPGCVQRPRVPFAIAATGPRGMQVAARFAETWVTTGDHSERTGVTIVTEQMARLDEECARAGRDPKSLARLVLLGVPLDSGLASPEAFADLAGHFGAAGVTDLVVHWPRPSEPFAGDLAKFERIFSR